MRAEAKGLEEVTSKALKDANERLESFQSGQDVDMTPINSQVLELQVALDNARLEASRSIEDRARLTNE